MNIKRLAVLGGLSAAIFASLVAATCGDTTTRVENSNAAQTGISVSGTGKTTGKPDLAQLTIGVSTLRDTVQAARDQAATSLDGIVKSLKANGVDDKDIQTQQLNIQPEYDYSQNKQRLTGFRVSNTLTAKIRDINKTSKSVDDAVNAGGDDTQIQGITFTIDKPDDLKQQARQKAVDDAKQKAQTLASAAGVTLGDPRTISETSYSPPIYAGNAAAAQDKSFAAAPATPIQPGELDVQIDVSVTWAIQ